MKVLITGVAGLLGSRLAEHILKTKPDVQVFGVDDLSGGYLENIPTVISHSNSFFLHADVNNVHTIEKTLFSKHQFDIVYHFAAYAAECVSPFIRKFNYTNNLLTTAGLVNLCIKYNVGRLVFTSSMAVYGRGEPPFDESDPRRPIDPYGVAKAACEMDIEIAGEQHGLDYCIIRPHNVYGRHQNIWDSYRNFVGIAIYKSMIGDPITIFGDGLQTRAFSEMSDSLEPLWRAGVDPKASKQIINLGGIEESSILDSAKIVCELSGADLIFLPPRHEVRHAYSTWKKSIEILGFEHQTSLYNGVKGMYEWALKQPKRERFIWSKYEIDNGLYPQWKPEALKDGYFRTKLSEKLP
jgi:UDP-glucose 4-epimerase